MANQHTILRVIFLVGIASSSLLIGAYKPIGEVNKAQKAVLVRNYQKRKLVTDTLLANQYFQKGVLLSERQEFDSGAYYLDLSRALYQQYGLHKKYLTASANLVFNLIYLDKIDSASQINRGLVRAFEQGQFTDTATFKKVLNYQGGIYSIAKKPDSAIVVTRKLLVLDKLAAKGQPDMLLGGTYHNLATLYTDYEMLEKAMRYYDSAEVIYQLAKATDSEEAARLYANKAIVLKLLGNYEESLTFNRHSYEIFKTVLKPDHPRLALAFFNIGNDLIDRNKGEPDNEEGIRYLNRGFDVLKQGKNLSHRYVPDYYRFRAKAHVNLQEYNTSVTYLETALRKSIEINEENLVEQAHIYEELGKVYATQQNFDAAHGYLDRSKQIYESVLNTDFKRIATIHNLKGSLFSQQKQYDRALKSYQKALSLFVAVDTADVFMNPAPAEFVTHENFFSALEGKASGLDEAYRENQKIAYLSAAFSTYELLDEYVQSSGKLFPDDYTKLAFIKSKGGFYENGILSGLLLFEKTHDQRALENTMQLAEHRKSLVLLEVLENKRAKMFANVPPSLLDEEQALTGALSYAQQKLSDLNQGMDSEKDSAAIRALEASIFNLKTERVFLTKKIEQSYPAYHQLKYEAGSLDISALYQQLSDDKTALLQYFVGEKNVYTWLLSQGQIDYVALPRPDDLDRQVEALLGSLKSHDFTTYTRQGYALYQLLLEPILAKVSSSAAEHLLIIPDGILGYIPFETLIRENPIGAQGYRDLRYMVNDYEIAYHYSASLLTFEQPPKPPPTRTFIGWAPTFRDNTEQQLTAFNQTVRSYVDSAQALPFARQEVSSIAALLKGDAYVGSQATERDFKQLAANYNIIHLASHSLIDDNDPLYSKLIFDTENDSIDDGLLHTYELYNLQLSADLVCLSACNTGVGKLFPGEGIVSLARGFLYAGVPNVMMSLWPVADRPTKDMMQYFYEGVRKDVPYATALHRAKLRYLERADNLTADPYYWGAFIYLGQPTASTAGPSYRIAWVIGFGLVVLLAGIVVYRKYARA